MRRERSGGEALVLQELEEAIGGLVGLGDHARVALREGVFLGAAHDDLEMEVRFDLGALRVAGLADGAELGASRDVDPLLADVGLREMGVKERRVEPFVTAERIGQAAHELDDVAVAASLVAACFAGARREHGRPDGRQEVDAVVFAVRAQ